jgi:monovalent cation:H+ antiporter, CPA1 family
VAATFGVVLFSLLGQGLTIAPLMKRLGVTGSHSAETPEVRRLMADLVACRAALSEIDAVRAAEAGPDWAVEALHRKYADRQAELETALAALQPDFREQADRRAGDARTIALQAERSAYRDSERQGRLAAEDWRRIAAEIDAELLALKRDMPK